MNFLEQRRLRLGFTQAELAKIIHVDRTTVGKWEQGKSFPCKKHLIDLSKALNCSIVDIVEIFYIQH